ncbi:hypothetical protein [Deinococcus sp. QL22]|uniref:hypothetical protein n=1 Tax=Deinococcus sp. QL22 TaxID=2939437 RepID=UPI00201725A3|nr:hypothetical protein [Deinococcus sp. QL22]UQN10132.1 hypothetical protein M1R55_28510 [Deinococcus sp. QL22]
MNVLRHNGEQVLVETEDRVVTLVYCLDRYTAHDNALNMPGGEQVQVWEDEQGTVIRLSQARTPGALWMAHAWV